ncbi:MAG TPA: MarR family transcriptional regulator [Kofleriaceae bacterium]
MIGAFVRRLRVEATTQPYTSSQVAVLRQLDEAGPMITADLARAQLVKPQTMGSLVGELEAAGLVARRDDSSDGRRRLVSLTAAGKRLLAESRRARQTWLAQALERHLDAREQRALFDALQLVRRITAS